MTPHASITDVVDDWPMLEEVLRVLTFQGGYNTNLVIGGTTLLGLAAGIVGVFALLRKRSLVTDALSHATLPGVAVAFLAAGLLGAGERPFAILLAGAAISGVLGVMCIHLILKHSRLGEDAAIGIVLSVFFGAGIVGLSFIQRHAPSGSAGLNHLIYGQAATMRPGDVMLMAGIAAAALALTAVFFKEFSLVCFNDAFARVDGWRVGLIDAAMMGLVVVVTVAGLQAVGLILVVAMLIIPAVAARFWTERLWLLIVIAGIIGAASGYLGSSMSALLPRKPAGAVIVLTSGAIFALSFVIAPGRGIVASAVRRMRLRLRIALDHLMELAHESASRSVSSRLERQQIDTLATLRGWKWQFRQITLLAAVIAGLASWTKGGVTVSRRGLARGARVSRNHALWEQYLISYADIAPNHVDWSVDQVEHVLSENLVGELESALERRGVPVPAPRATP